MKYLFKKKIYTERKEPIILDINKRYKKFKKFGIEEVKPNLIINDNDDWIFNIYRNYVFLRSKTTNETLSLKKFSEIDLLTILNTME